MCIPINSLYTISPGTLLPFCFANKQIHQEALSAWIRRTRFVVRKAELECRALNTLPTKMQGYKHVRMLSFANPTEYRWKEQINRSSIMTSGLIVQRCAGLRSLLIEVDSLPLWAFANYILTPGMKLGLCHGLELSILAHFDSLRHLKLILEISEPNMSRA